jgi:putative transposase
MIAATNHRPLFSVRVMSRCLRIQPSGFYAWLKIPLSNRAREVARQIKMKPTKFGQSGNSEDQL